MKTVVETPLQTVKVTIKDDSDNKTKIESKQPTEKVVTMKILTE